MEAIESFLAQFEGVTFGGIEVVTLATWFAAGIVAGVLLMGRRPVGILGDMVIGVLGGLLAGWVSNQFPDFRIANLIDGLNNPPLQEFIGNFIAAVLGAILVLLIIRMVIRKRG